MNWVGKSYFDIRNAILTFELSRKMLFDIQNPILTFDLCRKMLFWHSKSYFDIRIESENAILTFEILFWQSNRVGKSYFDIQNPILTFELSRIIVFWHSKSYFDIQTESQILFLWGWLYCFHVVRPPLRLSVRPYVRLPVTLFFLLSWKRSDGYSSISADTLISIRYTHIRISKG